MSLWWVVLIIGFVIGIIVHGYRYAKEGKDDQ